MYKIEKGIGNVKRLDKFLKFNNNALAMFAQTTAMISTSTFAKLNIVLAISI